VLGRTYEGQNCSVAKSLELVGERWTMLVVREVFLGNRRFDEMAGSSASATRSAPSASSTG
jgi:DNA-binding HxlR family transcriptional regulator